MKKASIINKIEIKHRFVYIQNLRGLTLFLSGNLSQNGIRVNGVIQNKVPIGFINQHCIKQKETIKEKNGVLISIY